MIRQPLLQQCNECALRKGAELRIAEQRFSVHTVNTPGCVVNTGAIASAHPRTQESQLAVQFKELRLLHDVELCGTMQ